MSVIIPEEILAAARMTEAELRLEIAVLLFQKEKLTLGQACRLAEMSRLQFQHLLASRQIPLHYDVAEFDDDLLTLEPQDGGKAVVNAGEATLSRWR